MKLTEEHIDKKVRMPNWKTGDYFIPKFFGKNGVIYGLAHNGIGTWFWVEENDWELVQEIPEHQAWVVPGRRYRLVGTTCGWFKLTKYNYKTGMWEGTNDVGKVVQCGMSCQVKWEEVQDKKTVRMAPALCIFPTKKEVYITGLVFASEKAAKEYYCKNFVKWPANENLWVEVDVDSE